MRFFKKKIVIPFFVFLIGSGILGRIVYDINQQKLEVDAAERNAINYKVLLGGLIIVLLMTGLTGALMILDEHRKKFKNLAVTDGLTGIYNRHGFDELVEEYLKQYPDQHCVAIQFDIDDFKFINDMYGHAAGDRALCSLAESMRKQFPENAVLGRNGGDEFNIFLSDCTCEDVKNQIERFTKMKRTFLYDGKDYTFSISLGYAEYPAYAKNYSELMHCADAALYEVKLRGKHDCLAYSEEFQTEIRTQLGFALKDISENVPGAFIIYKAAPKDDEILFANREMIRLVGCESMKDLLAYTERKFGNLVRDDEKGEVEKSIWNQIETGNSEDYVYFHLKKKDGTYVHVLDHGRIVENGHYGKVFYVLLMNWDLIKQHYGNRE